MSVRTIYNPRKHVSLDTQDAVEKLGISFDEFTSNIESKLQNLGEHRLRNQLMQEISASVTERDLARKST